MLKEVSMQHALTKHLKHESIYIMKPTDDKTSEIKYEVCKLSDILQGCKFLIDDESVSSSATDMKSSNSNETVSEPLPDISQTEPYTFPGCPKEVVENITKPKTHGRKRTVDVGKIKALKEAGWSKKDVADDMNVCLATVNRYWNADISEE